MDGTRVALVIANDQYADPGLRRLVAPAQDAAALADALGDPSVGGFEVTVLQNESAQEIRYAVEDFFADRAPEDLLLLHFSCHGLKNAAGELFLAVADTKPTRLASTAVAADFVNRQMADSRAQRIALFLDCCYGGAFPRGMVVRAAGEAQVRDAFAGQEGVGGGRGRVIVTASSAMEYAFEGGQLATDASKPRPSVFTGAVVDGLTTGEADRDGDGWVGLTELVGFVTDRVHRVTPNQNPQMWTFGSQGELLIARSRVRRITPTPLAPELLEAMDSPLTATRFGVVDYLREQVLGTDLGQAYAAWQALQQLTEDDSRKVSEAARHAVTAAIPQTSPADLSLDPTTPTTFQLTGPPLAQTAVATTPTPWLHIEQITTQIRLTTTPQPPGPHEATLLLTAPTGDRTIPLHLEVPEPAPPPVESEQPPHPAQPRHPDLASAGQQPMTPPEAEPASSAQLPKATAPATTAKPTPPLTPDHAAPADLKAQPQPQPASADRPPTSPRPIGAPRATPPEAQPGVAAQAAGVSWWVVVGLALGALLLIVINWPGPPETYKVWYDSDTGWHVYRSWSDPEILASLLALVASLAIRLSRRWAALALGVVAGCVSALIEDGFLILGSGIAVDEVNEWLATTVIAGAMAVGLIALIKPKLTRLWPVPLPAAALVITGGLLLLISGGIKESDGYSFLTVTKLAVLDPIVLVALAWFALAAVDATTKLWLSAATTTYAMFSAIAAVPALTIGGSSSVLLTNWIANGLVALAVVGSLLVSPGSPLRSRP